MRLKHQGSSIVVDTPAKLNLFLEVLQRREDGYHELETVMTAIDVFDTLRFSPTEDPSIRFQLSFDRRLKNTQVPVDERNICMQAARLMQGEYGVQQGVHIELHKRIPAQAGMGGGSSDAAAVLVALNHLWNLRLTSPELHGLASRLGSDVNFFIDAPGAALCRGRGEQVEFLATGSRWSFVVTIPDTGLSTAAVFQALSYQQPVLNVGDFLKSLDSGRTSGIAQMMYNRLEEPAARLSKQVDELLRVMRAASRLAPRMTGSGSACFALCHGPAEARSLAARLRVRLNRPVWVCNSCPSSSAA